MGRLFLELNNGCPLITAVRSLFFDIVIAAFDPKVNNADPWYCAIKGIENIDKKSVWFENAIGLIWNISNCLKKYALEKVETGY